ncbi:MAG TPA: hypothetical protein PLV82_04240 [bacterium]|nr:hypothetical protein [bacterium]
MPPEYLDKLWYNNLFFFLLGWFFGTVYQTTFIYLRDRINAKKIKTK